MKLHLLSFTTFRNFSTFAVLYKFQDTQKNKKSISASFPLSHFTPHHSLNIMWVMYFGKKKKSSGHLSNLCHFKVGFCTVSFAGGSDLKKLKGSTP